MALLQGTQSLCLQEERKAAGEGACELACLDVFNVNNFELFARSMSLNGKLIDWVDSMQGWRDMPRDYLFSAIC